MDARCNACFFSRISPMNTSLVGHAYRYDKGHIGNQIGAKTADTPYCLGNVSDTIRVSCNYADIEKMTGTRSDYKNVPLEKRFGTRFRTL